MHCLSGLLPRSSQQGELRPSAEMPGRREGWSSLPLRGPQRFSLLSLSHLPRKDMPTRWRGTELQLQTPGPQELSQPGIQGPRAPCLPRSPGCGLPGELPPTRSLSLAPEQSKLCVQGWHRSLRPPRANTSPSPRHSQPHCPSRTQQWGEWACALTPAEEGQHPVSPDPGRDPAWYPEHTPATAKSSRSRS